MRQSGERRAPLGTRPVARTAPDQAHAKEEAEVVPAPAVVRFVDAHLGGDEANEERDRHDEPVPQSGQKASGRGARYAVLGTRSRNGEEIGHWSPRVVRGDYCG